MRLALIATVLLAGCLQPAEDFSDGRSSRATTAAADKLRSDAGAQLTEPAEPAAYDWKGDIGPSHPEMFVSMSGQSKTGACPSSACFEFVRMNASCVYGLQANNTQYTATISTEDCDGLKRWFTSDVLLKGLRSPCGGYTGEEEVEVEATDPTYSAAKKFDGCTEEPFPSHRACLAAIRAKYFAGK